MSESKPWDLWEVILEETDSRWVRWEDYARLKAEVDDLRLENQAFKRTVNEASAHYDNRLADISRLKAEVEELTEEREQMESHYEDDTQTIAELRKELEDAQESNHILNETIARLMKGAKR